MLPPRIAKIDKHNTREQIIQRRWKLTDAQITQQSDHIFMNLTGIAKFSQSLTVASYVSWPAEPSTEQLNRTLADRGAKVLVPAGGLEPGWRLYGGELGDHRTLHSTLPPEALRDAELIIVPALAVDYQGTRLGRGAGWYDQMLTHRNPEATIIALVFDDEYLGNNLLPKEAHDIPVHFAVTPQRLHKFSA